jgi:DNA-directed RNA polymerase subunit RPC12/RpoP
MGDEDQFGKRLSEAADLVASREAVCTYGGQQIRDRFAPWLKRMRQFMQTGASGAEGPAHDANLGVRLLRYLYVRREEIIPIRGAWSIYGYHYPKLSMFLETDDVSIVKMLKYLESQALLEGGFHDKAYACARCGCNFLNFREVCPHCRSANLQVDDLVHHFRCGHVAPEPEFKEGGEMVCPKCSRPLNNLGTDYDKPSLVYTCLDCGHTFQEPEISTVCYNCDFTASPEEMEHQVVKRYRITALGENAAIHGLESLFREVLTEKMHVVDLDTFKVFAEIERNRILRYKKSESSVIYFTIRNLGSLHMELGDQAKAVFGELSEVVAGTLRTSDVVSPLNESTYLALLVETPLEGARVATRRLDENITELMRANVSREANIKTHAFSVSDEEGTKELLRKVMDHANAE